MSLISDTDYLIHNLRLNYLRNIDDPYGPRIISLDPSFQSNPYIDASGLADVERWPEVAMPTSPTPSDDESAPAARRRHSGFPGANLKYTTTILGPSRMGAMGMRVNGKRTSQAMPRNSVRLSLKRAANDSDAEDTLITTEVIAATPVSPTKPDGPRSPIKESASPSPAPPQQNGDRQVPPSQDGAQVPGRVPPFVPKFNFKGAAEMEARRRQRLLARAYPPGMAPKVPMVAMNLNPEISSSSSSEPEAESEGEEEEEEDIPDEDEDEFDMVGEGEDNMEVNEDEFDPEFAAASRGLGINSDSASDTASLLSGLSTSVSSMVASSLPPSTSARVSRLSPVREGGERERPSVSPERDEAPVDDVMFEMVTPAPRDATRSQSQPPARPSAKPSTSSSSLPTPSGVFERRPVAPARPAKSVLTAMLAATSNTSSSNPFAELYSAISGRAETESMVVRVFFPMAREPAEQALELNVRKDATVEEVLGYALWMYWEEGWLPKLDEGLDGEEDPKWAIRCSAAGWILRIAEEDGEVDEDFPPPDRTGKISKFNFDAYAVLEATQSQIQQNKILESKIQRRISRVVVKKKSTGLLNATSTTGNLAPQADSLLGTSANLLGLGSLSLGSSIGMFPSSLGPSSSHGPPLFLRIRIASAADEPGHVSTTIQASGGMYMAEVLDAVCTKRKLSDAKDYALVVEVGDSKMNIPLDRTVRSLQGKRELILMKKNMLREYGVEVRERKGTTDPNASIFTTDVATQEQTLSSMFDFMNAYRKYTVYRKMPMMVTRSARMLTIDGGYIHSARSRLICCTLHSAPCPAQIIPTVTKAKHVFDSGKTSSYHLKSVVACQQSSKSSATFKLVVHSAADRNKRYEFEAENPKLASEIVTTIRSLKSAMERSGGGKASRRNTRIGTARPMGV
ncbi:stress-activated map kinase interacting protein 1-domain-containing protein [Daedaleopsis nitida]|nr:stress-activated map kinase interacting protein 1-domain-containing protein [Daedaleopsis nitida]